MSKKQTRRAAREAFPKAKNPPAKKTPYGQRPSKSSSAGRGRSGSSAVRPPSFKKAVIWGAVMAFLYFVVIQWAWKNNGMTTLGNVVIALVGFVIFAGVVYATDHFKYQRYLRKKGSSK
jgi:hypothetical protein